ncbi:hypothetical protein HFN69_21975 [Rhizobium laguerreae]|uniref:hypothetical protein n=1 Tax=Rhizobium laguerreae TaxID=1076926 RepID=UPI001C912588|nr:hypothetical protein [Rhizobium laguerreae]MBY3544790.1 hypothetical protein [Rhizobium laguerreae]MBY3549247.1 hypothetical protein [Rhizobium laguerreae]
MSLLQETPFGPDVACPTYDEFARRYGGKILQEAGDLQLIDGDLAMTRDLDFMLGDKCYDAMRRLLDDWRLKAPHLQLLYSLSRLMIQREADAERRVTEATEAALLKGYGPLGISREPGFQKAWQTQFDEQGAAQAGRDVYPGCIMLMASYALSRFRDDIECTRQNWQEKGALYGGRSIGEIIVASANGVRHQDDWFKTHPPTPQQQRSMDVLEAALGVQGGPHKSYAYSAGRCEQVLALLDGGEGFDGLTTAMFAYAHEIALECRRTSSPRL